MPYLTPVSRILVIAFVALSTAYLSNCGLFKDDDNKKKKFRRYFVHGDPKLLIEGASLNAESPFTRENTQDFKDYNFYGGVAFSNRDEISETEETNIEEGQEASTGSDANDVDSFRFRENSDGSWSYFDLQGSGVEFIFVENDDKLNMTALKAGEFNLKLTPLHYSVTPDKKSFSMLAETNINDSYTLLAIYFTRNIASATLLGNVDSKFNYLLGPGVRAIWQDEIKIDICGTHSEADIAVMRSSFLAWADANDQIEGHKVTINATTEFKPFSDVNQFCARVVQDYLFESIENGAVLGITMTIINKSDRSIAASSMFISQSGLEKIYGTSVPENQFERTATHEFGHFIGIDHEFERDAAGNYRYPSIMGYGDVDELTAHDRESVALLYGGSKPRGNDTQNNDQNTDDDGGISVAID